MLVFTRSLDRLLQYSGIKHAFTSKCFVITVDDVVVVLQTLSVNDRFYGKHSCYKCDHVLSLILSVSLLYLDITIVFMVAVCNRADHYIFTLLFLSSSSSIFFSSTNLSGRRLDVYHTLTHGVALVRI